MGNLKVSKTHAKLNFFSCKEVLRVFRYKTGEDSVPPTGPWVIKTRSCLRKRQKNEAKLSQSTPPKIVVSDDREEPTKTRDVEERRQRHSRVDEVISKQDELLPVPPKLQKMRMRKKVGLQSFSKAPTIGWNEDDEADDREILSKDEEGEDKGEEVEEEREEELGDEAPQSGAASEIDGHKKADEEGEVGEGEEVGDDTDGKFVDFVQGIWDNSDRASVGMKLTRRCFGFSTTSPTQKVVG